MYHVNYWIENYGLIVVFFCVLLDLAGAPLPSFPVLLLAGALSLSGGSNIFGIVSAGISAAIMADLIWYVAGAKLGVRVLSLLCRLTLSPDSCVRQTQDTFARMGAWSLLFAKFVPGLRYISNALSGITGLSLPLFVLMDGIGDALYISLPVLLGRVFHNAVDSVVSKLVQLGEYGVGIVAGLFILYAAVRWIEREAFTRRLRMDRISVAELAELIDGGRTPIIFDVRPSDARIEGIIPGAIAAHPSEISAVLEQYPRDVEVVIYCSCPNEASAAMSALHLKRAGFKKIRPLLGGIEAWAKAGRQIEMVV